MLTQIYRYKVLRVVSQSATNEVFEARDPVMDQIVKIYRWTPTSSSLDASLAALDGCLPDVQGLGVDVFSEGASICLVATTDDSARLALDRLRSNNLFSGYWLDIIPEPPPKPSAPSKATEASQAPTKSATAPSRAPVPEPPSPRLETARRHRHVPDETPPPKKSGWVWKAVLVLVPIIGIIYFVATATMREFTGFVDNRRLVNTVGPSALSAYQKAVSEKGATSSLVKSMNEKALPVLQDVSKNALDAWRTESELSRSSSQGPNTQSPISSWDDMVRLQEWLLQIDPTPRSRAQYAYARGNVAIEQRRWDEARQQFEAALQNLPNWPLALNGVGKAYVGLKDYQMADKYYHLASQADTSWYYPHFNLGALYRDLLRNFNASEQEFRAAIQLDPNRPSFHLGLGLAYYMHGREYWSAACSEFRTMRSTNKPASSSELKIVGPYERQACRGQ